MDTDQVYFGPDLSDEAPAKISFYSGNYGPDSFLGSGFDLGFQQTSWARGLSGYHIIPSNPVPEPENYATGLLLLRGSRLFGCCRVRTKPRIQLVDGKMRTGKKIEGKSSAGDR